MSKHILCALVSIKIVVSISTLLALKKYQLNPALTPTTCTSLFLQFILNCLLRVNVFQYVRTTGIN